MSQPSPKQRAVITAVGKDAVGIVAAITDLLAKYQINILDINQTTMEQNFAMIMLVDLEKSNLNVAELSQQLNKLAAKIGQQIHVHDEEIIQAMHRI